MTELVWEDPPKRQGRGRDKRYDAIIDQLKANPERWGRITKDWKTHSGPKAFKDAGCEMKSIRNEDGKNFSVYARYTPRNAVPSPTATEVEKAKVREAVKTGTALTPPPAAPRGKAPAAAALPAPVTPANDFGMAKFRADRAARGVPTEGKR